MHSSHLAVLDRWACARDESGSPRSLTAAWGWRQVPWGSPLWGQRCTGRPTGVAGVCGGAARVRRRRALYCNTTQAWCPATHFGYQTQGTCKIKFEDGTETTINAGDSYLVDKPHLPEIIGDETVIMHEFSQQVKKVLDSMKD